MLPLYNALLFAKFVKFRLQTILNETFRFRTTQSHSNFLDWFCEKTLTASCRRAANVIEKRLLPIAELQIYYLEIELICEYLISISFLVLALLDDNPHHSASIHTESENKYTLRVKRDEYEQIYK